MERIKNYTMIIMLGIIVILLFWNSCNNPVTDKSENKPLVTHDTFVKVTPPPDTVVVTKIKYFPVAGAIQLVDSSKWNKDLCKFERTYLDSIPDSNVTIYTDIKTIGILKSSQIKYKLHVPLRIETTIRTDSTYIKTVPNKWEFLAIGGIGGNESKFNATLGASLKYKRGYYGYEYNFVDKTHNAKVGFMLLKSKK